MAIKAVLLLLVVFLGVFLPACAEFLIGHILLRFPSTRFAGVRLIAVSGLFPKSIPRICPKHICDIRSCGNWTCPLYGSPVSRS